MTSPRLLLIGPGHANLLVLEALRRGRLPQADVVLVSPEQAQVYSGMVSGYVEGRYRAAEIAIDLGRLSEAAGARIVQGRVARIDPARRIATLDGGAEVPFDVASVAIGGVPAGAEIPGVRANALTVKPIDRAVELRAVLDRVAATPRPEPRRMTVVGAGATGLELALCARARLDRQGASDVIISIIDSRSELFGGRRPEWSDLVTKVLAEHDIGLRLGVGAAEVGPDFLRLTDGRVQPADLIVWAAGPHAPTLFRESGLPVDAHGFLLVEDTLEAQGISGLFGAGDAVTLLSAPHTPKAGVFAVRMGDVLIENLGLALAGGRAVRRYEPQARYLALLNAGDGRALLFYGPVALAARWAMWLKHRIDRRFMARFPHPRGGTGTWTDA
jgi:NADH dehydrogenase FAD-containing subunit